MSTFVTVRGICDGGKLLDLDTYIIYGVNRYPKGIGMFLLQFFPNYCIKFIPYQDSWKWFGLSRKQAIEIACKNGLRL